MEVLLLARVSFFAKKRLADFEGIVFVKVSS
jgi:hypothetical protein